MSFFGKISTRERYGLRLALKISGTYKTKTPISLQQVSNEEKISMKYLEQLIVPLRKAGWVESIRGRDGGYLMLADPAKITLKDLIWLINDEPFVISCLNSECVDKCELEKKCSAKKAWKKVQEALEDSMGKIKISELLHK